VELGGKQGMADTFFTKDHEWIAIDGGVGTIGITNYAQEQLGDVVFVELPEISSKVEKGSELAVVESVKAASEVYAPISGEIIEINEAVVATPDLINSDPESSAWFVKVKVANADGETPELMDADAYAGFIAGLG
jgi:glycine cleavage system H protein